MAAKFDMPGQTKALDPNAADTDALTLFYESLHKQRPESEMAQRWLLQHGLLPEDEAAKLAKLFGKAGASKSSGGGSKAPPKRKVRGHAVRRPERDRGSCAIAFAPPSLVPAPRPWRWP